MGATTGLEHLEKIKNQGHKTYVHISTYFVRNTFMSHIPYQQIMQIFQIICNDNAVVFGIRPWEKNFQQI